MLCTSRLTTKNKNTCSIDSNFTSGGQSQFHSPPLLRYSLRSRHLCPAYPASSDTLRHGAQHCHRVESDHVRDLLDYCITPIFFITLCFVRSAIVVTFSHPLLLSASAILSLPSALSVSYPSSYTAGKLLFSRSILHPLFKSTNQSISDNTSYSYTSDLSNNYTRPIHNYYHT